MKESMKDPGKARELPVTNQDKPEEGPRHVGVAMRHFDLAFRKIKPSVSEQVRNFKENGTVEVKLRDCNQSTVAIHLHSMLITWKVYKTFFLDF